MDRDMFEFLAAEVLEEMPAELREFLLRCSILPQFSARRAAMVSGDARAEEHVAEIDRRGLFVTVQDGEEPVLTLHDLVREFLEQRLTREHPELLRELLLRAAASEPDPARRMSYLLRAGAVQEAEQALEEAAQPLLAVSAAEPVLHLIENFPPERRERSPILLMLRGEAAWERWDWRGMSEAMRRAAAGFEAAGDPRRLRRAQVFAATAKVGDGLTEEAAASVEGLDLSQADVEARALGAAIRTWCAIDTGRFDLVAERYMAVLEVLEQTEQLRPWSHCFQRTLYVWFPGMAPVITRLADGIMRRSGERATPIRAIANVYLAWLALWRGELALAHERLTLAEGDARWIGNPVRTAMFLNTARALLHAVQGEAEQARNALEAIFRYFATSALPSGPVAQPTSMQGHYRLLAVRLADALGDAAMLREQAALIPPPRQIKNHAMIEAPLATVPARLAALEGRHAEAAAIWARLLAQEAKLDMLGLAEETRLRHADSLLQLGRREEAAAALKPLLARVAETGAVGGVLLAGRATIARVAGAAWREELAWTELAMLRGWAQRYGGGAPVASPPAADAGPLTARELDVLARIAAGESNKLIARGLELSPHTVKRHVANILEKLEISSRGEAAAWYRAQPPMARR